MKVYVFHGLCTLSNYTCIYVHWPCSVILKLYRRVQISARVIHLRSIVKLAGTNPGKNDVQWPQTTKITFFSTFTNDPPPLKSMLIGSRMRLGPAIRLSLSNTVFKKSKCCIKQIEGTQLALYIIFY